jgi:inward rectifier potassium channel
LSPKATRTQYTNAGSPVVRIGAPRPKWSDFYHRLLRAPWWHVATVIVASYATANALFAALYLWIGDAIENARPGSFEDAYFFSVQTMATIGYGKMVPKGPLGNLLVTLEALTGLVGVAMATGLLFAKFSRPTARVMFSDVVVVSPRDGVPSLMVRMANERESRIVEAQLRVVLLKSGTTEEGERVRRFHDLALLRGSTTTFALTWTAVHPIREGSPLFGETAESLAAQEAELWVSLVGIEETMSQTVHARHGYLASDIRWGERFVDILGRFDSGDRTIDYTRFHETEKMKGG